MPDDRTLDEVPVHSTAPVAYPDNAVLTQAEVAAWLRCSERQVRRLPIERIPGVSAGALYLAGDVYAFLRSRRVAA